MGKFDMTTAFDVIYDHWHDYPVKLFGDMLS